MIKILIIVFLRRHILVGNSVSYQLSLPFDPTFARYALYTTMCRVGPGEKRRRFEMASPHSQIRREVLNKKKQDKLTHRSSASISHPVLHRNTDPAACYCLEGYKTGSRRQSQQCIPPIILTMPLYVLYHDPAALSLEQKKQIAKDITTAHCTSAGVASFFVKVVFQVGHYGDLYTGGEIDQLMLRLVGTIRAGRDSTWRDGLLKKLHEAVKGGKQDPAYNIEIHLEETDASVA